MRRTACSTTWGRETGTARPKPAGNAVFDSASPEAPTITPQARAQAALLIVEQAHATPFAQAEALPALPAWCRPASAGLEPAASAAFVLLGRSWFRRFPASAPATLALVAVAAGSLRGQDSPLAVAAACLGIAAYSMTRAVDLDRVDAAVMGAGLWLGATAATQRQVTLRLALALALPALASLILAAATGAWVAAIAGLLAGSGLAWALLLWSERPSLANWTGRLLLVVALLMAAAPGPEDPARPVAEVQPR